MRLSFAAGTNDDSLCCCRAQRLCLRHACVACIALCAPRAQARDSFPEHESPARANGTSSIFSTPRTSVVISSPVSRADVCAGSPRSKLGLVAASWASWQQAGSRGSKLGLVAASWVSWRQA
eukprot:365533-Chlamydomonas_euryale.AAC.1